MKTEINKEEAYKIWNKYLKTEYLKSHTLESEAIMRKLANHLAKDEEFWGITGLLHDLDMDVINGNYKGVNPGRALATFLMGSKRLYEYVDDNPLIFVS